MHLKYFAPLTIVFVGILGCGSNATVNSTDVNEAKIYQHYSVDYDPNSKALTLFAQFALGNISGTTIRLADSSKVTVDDQAMTVVGGDKNTVNIIGTYYRLTSSVDKPNSTYTFKWARTDGKAFVNVATMSSTPSVAGPAAGSEVSRGTDLSCTFSGDDLKAGESLSFNLVVNTQAASGLTTTAVSRSITSGKQSVIAKNDMTNLVDGSASVYATRLGQFDTQQGNAGIGGAIFTYSRSPEVSVTVKD